MMIIYRCGYYLEKELL